MMGRKEREQKVETLARLFGDHEEHETPELLAAVGHRFSSEVEVLRLRGARIVTFKRGTRYAYRLLRVGEPLPSGPDVLYVPSIHDPVKRATRTRKVRALPQLDFLRELDDKRHPNRKRRTVAGGART